MRFLPILLVFAFFAVWTAPAATLTVCTSGCTYVNAQLQTALNTAACGDTVQLQAGVTFNGNFTITGRGCSASTPITLISSRADWLPLAGTRITPSHQGNMARLRTINTGPALAAVLSGSGEPANHWHFIGIEFDTTFTSGIVFQLVNLHNGYMAADAEDLATGIVFDRCYFHGNRNNTTSIQSGLRLETREATVKNSFFDDLVAPGFENHAIDGYTVEGPWTIENNFFAVGSIPVFAGGAQPDYLGAGLTNATVRYNYLSKHYKWWGPSAVFSGATYNPYYADFTANGGVVPCMKNLGEFKNIDTALWEFNVHELSPGNCQGQYFGFTATPRIAWYWSVAGYTAGMGTASTSTSSAILTYTGSGSFPATLVAGMGACAVSGSSPNRTAYCNTIASINPGTKEITTTTNFGVSGSGLSWIIVAEPDLLWKDVTVQNNVFREVGGCFQILGTDPSNNNATGKGVVTNLTIRNNLCVNNSLPSAAFLRLIPQDNFNMAGVTKYLDGLVFENNGGIVKEGLSVDRWALIGADELTGGNYFHKVTIRNNYSSSGNFGFNLSGSGGGFGAAAVNNSFAADAVVRNNAMPTPAMVGQSWSCSGGRNCSGNLTGSFNPKWASNEIRKLQPSSPYAKAGLDRQDLGPNVDQLPLINNLKTTPSQNSVQLDFDLAAPTASIPCVLEVSADRDVQSALGDYTVISALNPVFFKQPDVSNRTNPKLAPIVRNGLHVQWPVGQAGAVMGDDGVNHDLALTPATAYFGRLQCGGDTRRFDFRTLPASNTASTFTIKAAVPAGTTTLVADYGPTPSLGASASAVPDGGLRAAVNVPFTSGTLVYYRLRYQAGVATTYTGPLQSMVF